MTSRTTNLSPPPRAPTAQAYEARILLISSCVVPVVPCTFPTSSPLDSRLQMAPTAIIERGEPVTFAPKSAPLRSRLPAPLRIAILFVLSLGINVSLWSAVAPFLGNELGAVSKRQDDLVSPFAVLAYKIVLIGLGWNLDYDCMAMATHFSTRISLLTLISFSHRHWRAHRGRECPIHVSLDDVL
jgi:hypothetical protein